MGGGEDEVFLAIDEVYFGFGVVAPEEENKVFFVVVKVGDDGFDEDFPALVFMGAHYVCLGSEDVV